MKILTIRQPHVAAIFARLKTFETRSKPTHFRGQLGIHAAARPDVDRLAKLGFLSPRDSWQRILSERFGKRLNVFDMGAIIGVAELVDCIPTTEVPGDERAWGDFTPGRWAWRLDNPRLLPEPIPARGSLSFWNFDVEAPK